MKMKHIIELEKIEGVLRTLYNETCPIDGHGDVGAIQDCWSEVFDYIQQEKKKYYFISVARIVRVTDVVGTETTRSFENYAIDSCPIKWQIENRYVIDKSEPKHTAIESIVLNFTEISREQYEIFSNAVYEVNHKN